MRDVRKGIGSKNRIGTFVIDWLAEKSHDYLLQKKAISRDLASYSVSKMADFLINRLVYR